MQPFFGERFVAWRATTKIIVRVPQIWEYMDQVTWQKLLQLDLITNESATQWKAVCDPIEHTSSEND